MLIWALIGSAGALPSCCSPVGWRITHSLVLRSCYGSDGISQAGVNVMNRDLPGTRVAHSQCNPCGMNQNLTGMCPVNEEDCAGA